MIASAALNRDRVLHYLPVSMPVMPASICGRSSALLIDVGGRVVSATPTLLTRFHLSLATMEFWPLLDRVRPTPQPSRPRAESARRVHTFDDPYSHSRVVVL